MQNGSDLQLFTVAGTTAMGMLPAVVADAAAVLPGDGSSSGWILLHTSTTSNTAVLPAGGAKAERPRAPHTPVAASSSAAPSAAKAALKTTGKSSSKNSTTSDSGGGRGGSGSTSTLPQTASSAGSIKPPLLKQSVAAMQKPTAQAGKTGHLAGQPATAISMASAASQKGGVAGVKAGGTVTRQISTTFSSSNGLHTPDNAVTSSNPPAVLKPVKVKDTVSAPVVSLNTAQGGMKTPGSTLMGVAGTLTARTAPGPKSQTDEGSVTTATGGSGSTGSTGSSSKQPGSLPITTVPAAGVLPSLAPAIDALLTNADLIELPPALEKRLEAALQDSATRSAGSERATVPASLQQTLTAFLRPLLDGSRTVVIPTSNVGLVLPVSLQKAIMATT
jgi:hypothetical protein